MGLWTSHTACAIGKQSTGSHAIDWHSAKESMVWGQEAHLTHSGTSSGSCCVAQKHKIRDVSTCCKPEHTTELWPLSTCCFGPLPTQCSPCCWPSTPPEEPNRYLLMPLFMLVCHLSPCSPWVCSLNHFTVLTWGSIFTQRSSFSYTVAACNLWGDKEDSVLNLRAHLLCIDPLL